MQSGGVDEAVSAKEVASAADAAVEETAVWVAAEAEDKEQEGSGVLDENAILSENNPFTSSFSCQ